MLSFIAKRRTKAQKFKSSIRLISEPPVDFTAPHNQTLDIFGINEKPRQSPPVPAVGDETTTEDTEDPVDTDRPESPSIYSSEQPEDVPPALLSTVSPRVDVSINEEPLNDWFPRHLLKSSSSNERDLVLSSTKKKDPHSDGDEDVDSFEQQQQSSPPTKDRRLPPTPIKIPNPHLHGPKVQLQRSSIHGAHTTMPSARPESTVSLDNLSSVSGTTLARALLGTSFVFPANDSSRRSSRYRSGMTTLTRADSATLPRCDDPLLHSPYWRDGGVTPDTRDGSIPPVPPVPSTAELEILDMKVEERRTASKLLSYSTAAKSLRVSRITEGSSPSLTEHSTDSSSPGFTDTKSSLSTPIDGSDKKPPSSSSLTPSTGTASDHLSPAARSMTSLPRSVPTTASLYPSTPEFSPAPVPSTASSGDGLDNVLDYYQFAASWEYHTSGTPEHPHHQHPGRPAFSPITEETSSACLSSGTNSPFTPGKRGQSSATSPSPANSGLGRANRIDTSPSQMRTMRKGLLPIGEQSPSSPTLRAANANLIRGIPSESGTVRLTHKPSSSSQSSIGGDNPLTSENSAAAPGSHVPGHRRGFSTRARSGSGTIPSPITVIRDSRDPRKYKITVTPSEDELFAEPPVEVATQNDTGVRQSQNIQTFPETPRAFSPLWSPTPAGSTVPSSRASLAESGSSFSSLAPGPRKAPSQTSLRSLAAVGAANARLSPLVEVPSSQPSPVQGDERTVDVKVATQGDQASGGRANAVDLNALAADSELAEGALVSPRTVVGIVNGSSSPGAPSQASEPHLSPVISTPSSFPAPSPSQSTTPSSRIQEYEASSSSASSISQQQSERQANPPPRITPLPPLPIHAQAQSSTNNRHYYHSGPEMQDAGLLESYSTYFGAPPPAYHTLVPIQLVDPGAGTQQPTTPSSDRPPPFRTAEETASRRLTRSRPPLPAGPRRPSGGITTLSTSRSRAGSEHNTRQRNGSISSVNSTQRPTYSSCSPKFRPPEPRWKGLTMDAAKWTFTSSELQDLVSQSIRQSAETSAVRVVHPQLFNVEIPAELKRLQTERGELTTKYKVHTRKRHALLGALSAQSESREASESSSAWTRTLEELTSLSNTLDTVAEELLSNAEQTTQITSLRDIHSYSALAMALRKLNTSFVKQVDENQLLRERVAALESAKDEAWKEAETLANDYDTLAENLPDEDLPESAKSRHRLSRVSRRKSRCSATSQLRSGSLRRSQRYSTASSINVLSSAGVIPPVPPIPRGRQLDVAAHRLTRESTGTHSDASVYENTAMLRAQQELYEMLGIPQSARMKRSLTFSGGANTPTGAPPSPTLPISSEGTQLLVPGKRSRRPSSLPSTAGLHELYETVSADRQAILSTLGIIAAD